MSQNPQYQILNGKNISKVPKINKDLSEETRIIFVSLDVIILLLIVIGNLSVLITIFRNKRFRTNSTMWFVASVACAHLLIGLFVLPMFIITHYPDTLPTGLCRILRYFEAVAHTASPYTLLVATIDQFLDHMEYRVSSASMRLVRTQILVVWIWALVYSIRNVFLYGSIHDTYLIGDNLYYYSACDVLPDKKEIMNVLHIVDAILRFLLPTVICYILHGRVFHRIWCSEQTEDHLQGTERRYLMITILTMLIVDLLCELPEVGLKIYVNNGPGYFENYEVYLGVTELISFTQGWLNVVLIYGCNPIFRAALCGKDLVAEEEQKEKEESHELHPMILQKQTKAPPQPSQFGEKVYRINNKVRYESAL